MNRPAHVGCLVRLEPVDVSDSTQAIQGTYARSDYAGVCVVDGFGCRVSVERGALEVHDGIGPYRRLRRYDRATHGLRRLVIANAAGTVSLDALRWCGRLGIGVVVLGADGAPQLASTPRLADDSRLRRTQALAPTEPYGLDLAGWLLGRKVAGQAHLLARRFGDRETAETIADLVGAIEQAETIEAARQLEASAAALYFGAWSGRPATTPRFAAQDRKRVPPHWAVFETRRSVLASANSNRKAERPVNALLNYCFGLLEAEAVFACQAVGLDPGLGIVHSDARRRQSMALDLIEPVRPEVEIYVLDLIERRTFRKVEFIESPEGHVRLRAPLTHELAEQMPTWARSLAPVAEHVAHVLGAAMSGSYVATTPLTRRSGKAAQAVVKARKVVAYDTASSRTARQRPVAGQSSLPWNCPDCGAPVTNTQHVRCDACIAADPSQSPEIRGRRAKAIASRRRVATEWDAAHGDEPYDPERFRRDILPGLAGVKLVDIMAATGWSKSFASRVRAGRSVPHVSTWRVLAALTDVPPSH